MERIASSARLEAQIEELLGDELAANSEKLAELGRLGARLVLQRAVEDEVTAFLGRARYQRTVEAAGSRNGTRPKSIQTAEGELLAWGDTAHPGQAGAGGRAIGPAGATRGLARPGPRPDPARSPSAVVVRHRRCTGTDQSDQRAVAGRRSAAMYGALRRPRD